MDKIFLSFQISCTACTVGTYTVLQLSLYIYNGLHKFGLVFFLTIFLDGENEGFDGDLVVGDAVGFEGMRLGKVVSLCEGETVG